MPAARRSPSLKKMQPLENPANHGKYHANDAAAL